MKLAPNFVCAAMAVVTAGMFATTASANTFDWNYTDGGSNVGSGTLVADETSPGSGVFTLSSISGTANGETVNNSPALGYALSGSTLYWNASAPPIFDPANPFFFTDYNGFAFQTTSGDFFALYENTGLKDTNDIYACGATALYCLIGPGSDVASDGLSDPRAPLTQFALVAETPLPAALPLFASGVGALGLLGWRRKKKAGAVTA